MRKVGIGTSKYTEVYCADEPNHGGACHEYFVLFTEGVETSTGDYSPAQVFFQKGPVKELGINGCHDEDLLAIVIDRLKGFQNGPLACRENAIALTKIEEALHWLNHRTAERQAQGVEGTNEHS